MPQIGKYHGHGLDMYVGHIQCFQVALCASQDAVLCFGLTIETRLSVFSPQSSPRDGEGGGG